MGLFLIENELGKRFNNIMMDLSTTKFVFINILHKSVSTNSDIFFYMEFFMSDVGQGSQPTSAAAPVQKGRLQKYLLFLKKRKLSKSQTHYRS